MDNNAIRSLQTVTQVIPFLEYILDEDNDDVLMKYAYKIIEAEKALSITDSTWSMSDMRHISYADERRRRHLRMQIIKELLNIERLKSDENIKLGSGGARPKSEILSEKKFFYIIGLPASGKSTIASDLADKYGAFILDSDYAKRKFPEYSLSIRGASLVHEESDRVVFDYNGCDLLHTCIKNSYNIVVPKIGHDLQSILTFCQALRDKQYSVYLILVNMNRKMATQRAFNRFIKTGRYVPLSLIFDGYGDNPELNYYKLTKKYTMGGKYHDLFAGFASISTNSQDGGKPVLESEIHLSDLSSLWRRIKWKTVWL